VIKGQLPQRAGSLGLNGGGAAATVPPEERQDKHKKRKHNKHTHTKKHRNPIYSNTMGRLGDGSHRAKPE